VWWCSWHASQVVRCRRQSCVCELMWWWCSGGGGGGGLMCGGVVGMQVRS